VRASDAAWELELEVRGYSAETDSFVTRGTRRLEIARP